MLNTRTSKSQPKPLQDAKSILFQSVMELSDEAIFILDNANYTIVDCNKSALRLFEATNKSELINTPSHRLFNYEPIEFSSDKITKELKEKGEYSQEMSFITRKKNIFWGKLTQKNIGFSDIEMSVLKIEKSANYLQDEKWLSEILSIISKTTGRSFFKEITRLLCRTFNAEFAFIARRIAGDDERLKIFYMHGSGIKTKYINRNNSFVENTLRGYASFYPSGLEELFQNDELVKECKADSFIGAPFFEVSQEAMGLIGVLSTGKMTEIPNSRYMLNILASRTSAEIHRIRSKEILRHQTKNLAEINQMKDKLLSVISNDLQAPLNTLLGYSGMLRNNMAKYNPEELMNRVRIMDNSMKNLYSILENLTDWSKLQQGTFHTILRKNNLANIFEDIKPHIKYLSEIRNLALINKIPSVLNVNADNYMVRSVFKNLTGYLVKNSKKGGSIIFDAHVKKGVWSVYISTGKHLADIDELDFVLTSTRREFYSSSDELSVPALGVFIAREFMRLQEGLLTAKIADREIIFQLDFKKA